tara:strand:+ start:2687 stop:3304 length:618 start_codon:yes stop_codon:yes gene_type:complete
MVESMNPLKNLPSKPISLPTIIDFTLMFAPQILGITTILLPIFNGYPEKALLYLVLTTFVMLLTVMINSTQTQNKVQTGFICNIFSLFGYASDCPSFNTTFMSFTAAYLIAPMVLFNEYNLWAMSTILFLVLADTGRRLLIKCSTLQCVVMGAVIGILCGWGIVYMLSGPTFQKFLYFTELADKKIMCPKNSGDTGNKYKCVKKK